MMMTKEQLIQMVAEKLAKRDCFQKIVDSIFEQLTLELAAGKSFTITGFGNFSVREMPKRKGFNPAIEKFMMLPPKLKVYFKTSDILKNRINT